MLYEIEVMYKIDIKFSLIVLIANDVKETILKVIIILI